MTIFKRPLHRKIERAFKCKKDSLQKAVTDLKTKYHFEDKDVIEKAKECAQYCIENKTNFAITFNMYVSCLNNPKV